MIEYILSYAIRTVIIYFYAGWALSKSFSLLAVVVQVVAIWWLVDNVITPLLNQEDRDAFFSKIFSVDVLNLCLSIYYLFGGILLFFLYKYWNGLTTWYWKMLSLFIFLVAYNRIYFSIINMNDKQISEGFCACAM